MKKFIFFVIVTILFGKNICFNLNNVNIDKLAAKEVKLLHQNIPYNSVVKSLKYQLFFAKKYNFKDKNIIAELGAIQFLYSAYRNYLIKKYSPNEKVLKSFYIEYKDNFAPQTFVNISTIKVTSLKTADKIYSILKKHPSEFDKLAKKYSLENHIHYIKIPLSKFNYKIRQMIRKSKKGDIIEPIKIGNFYYIDKIDEKKTLEPTFKNLKPELKKILVQIYVDNLMKKMYEDQQ